MKLLHRLKISYDNLKLQTKYTICILSAVCIPLMILALTFSTRLYDMVIADTIQGEQKATALTAPLIEESLRAVIDDYTALTEYSYYRTLFKRPVSTPLSTLAGGTEARAFSQQVKKLTTGRAITAVRIYLDIPGQDAFFDSTTAKDLFLPISYANGTYWHGIFQGTKAHALYCPSFYLGNRELDTLGDLAYITASTLYYYGKAYPCYTAVYFSSGHITELLQDAISFPGSVAYIINERNSLISSTDDYLSAIYRLRYETMSDALMSSNNFVERNVLGEQIYAGYYYIREPGWILVTVLPAKPLVQRGIVSLVKIALICLACALIVAIFTIWQTRSITTRISSVIYQMGQLKQGAPASLPDPEIFDEVGDLITTYNYMTSRMNRLIEQQEKTAEELRIAEFNSLQAQINPHFLYNTMDMINWMALQGQTAEISNVVQNLAHFYKLTLSSKNNFNSIKSELKHVSIYVELQNMRYQNAFDFVIDLPDELYRYEIPKLTLQPIIENCILHGILEKEEKSGTIVVTGWTEDTGLALLVSDDGVGIPREKLPLLLSGQNAPASAKGNNIAVYNIHRRLKLLYGEAYGLSYNSMFGEGTEVTIHLPLQPASE